MKSTTTILKRALVAIGSLMLLAATGLAQNQTTTGTGTLSGSIANSVQLTSGGAGSITGNFNGGSVTSTAQGSQVTGATITFGDISPNNTTAAPYVIAQLPLQLRSNCNYSFTVLRGGTLGASSAGTFGSSDVGVSINNFTATGDAALVTGTAISGAAVTAGFSATTNTPASIATLTNGIATYTGSLAGVSTATPTSLIGGTRVSNGGDNTSSNNALTFRLNFIIKPQYYTTASGAPLTFSETLTFGIVAVP